MAVRNGEPEAKEPVFLLPHPGRLYQQEGKKRDKIKKTVNFPAVSADSPAPSLSIADFGVTRCTCQII